MFSEFKTDWDVSSQETVGYDESNGKIIDAPAYVMVDAQASIKNLWGKLRIDLNIKNILNTSPRIPYGSNTSWASQGMIGRGDGSCYPRNTYFNESSFVTIFNFEILYIFYYIIWVYTCSGKQRSLQSIS